MSAHITHASSSPGASGWDQRKLDLDKRLSVLFWALLFILTGTIWLFPQEQVPHGIWLTALGVILLALNAARYLNGVPIRVLPTILGAIALAAGLAQLAGVEMPIISLTLIAIGVSVVLELVSARKT